MSEAQQDIPMEDVKAETESGFTPLYDPMETSERKPRDTTSKEKKPQPVVTGPRQPLGELVGIAWTGVGTILEQTGTDVPVGRVMQFQAPIAGKTIDDVIKGTWLDEILQPFVSKVGAVEGIGSLLALPLLVGMYERNPGLGFALEPLMIATLTSQMADIAPVMKAQQKKQRDAATNIKEFQDALQLDKDADPIAAMLDYIFGPMAQPEEAPPEPEAES